MTFFQAIILGIIQGMTEFIPVSSSGHLVLAPYLFGWHISPKEAFVFDVLAQAATLVAVLIYFWKDLWEIFTALMAGLAAKEPFQDQRSRLGYLILLSSLPAGITALLFKDTFEAAFNSPRSSALFLSVTALLLILAERVRSRQRSETEITWFDALWVGFFQILALFPGISRSGSTISGGMTRGLHRKAAARFSFLMSIPVLTASGLLALYDLSQMPELYSQLPAYLAGCVAAGLVGYGVIHWLLSYLSQRSLYPFAVYCVVVSGLFVILITVGG